MKSTHPFFALFVMLFVVSQASAAPTTAVLGGGVSINEILIDPTGTMSNVDTDANGTAAATDEFVELYNGSSDAVDISGWQLWDSDAGNWFTFPGLPDDGTTVLESGAYAVVITGVQATGMLPTMTNPNSEAFDAERGTAVITNTGDNVVLYDPGANEYIQLRFNGVSEDNPPLDYGAFPAMASRVGGIEDWGNPTDGYAQTRYPSGDTSIGRHDTVTPGGGAASPTAVFLNTTSASKTQSSSWWFAFTFLLLGSAHALRKRKNQLTHHQQTPINDA